MLIIFEERVFAADEGNVDKIVSEQIEKFRKEKKEKQHPKIDPKLTDVEDEYKNHGTEAAIKIAKENSLKVKDNYKVRVDIVLRPGLSAADFPLTVFEPYEVDIITSAGDGFLADVPFNRIRELADQVEAIYYLRPSQKFRAHSFLEEGRRYIWV